MLRSNSKSLGNHVVSPEEEKERLQLEGFAEKEGFKSGMKERVGDGKLIIISMTVRISCRGHLITPVFNTRLPKVITVSHQHQTSCYVTAS